MNTQEAPSLTDPEIEILVGRYIREMARYEEAARLVEDRLRRELRANAIRALLSSRAKHPEDLRGKLAKKRSDVRYAFTALDRAMNDIVTDLSGCRVMVYRRSDVDKVEHAVKAALDVAEVPNAVKHHNRPSGYRATHILVRISENEERISLRGAICEVQIVSLASHVYNELEHDISYKDHDCPPSAAELGFLEDVLHAARLVDSASELLLKERSASVNRQTARLNDAEELRFALEHAAGRPLQGEFGRLFKLLDTAVQPLTAGTLADFGPVHELLDRGLQHAQRLGIEETDDAVLLALALFDEYADEFSQVVREQRGRATLLKKAILRAAEQKEQGRDSR